MYLYLKPCSALYCTISTVCSAVLYCTLHSALVSAGNKDTGVEFSAAEVWVCCCLGFSCCCRGLNLLLTSMSLLLRGIEFAAAISFKNGCKKEIKFSHWQHTSEQGSRKFKIGLELTKNGCHVRCLGLLKKTYIFSLQTNYPYYCGFYASFLGF